MRETLPGHRVQLLYPAAWETQSGQAGSTARRRYVHAELAGGDFRNGDLEITDVEVITDPARMVLSACRTKLTIPIGIGFRQRPCAAAPPMPCRGGLALAAVKRESGMTRRLSDPTLLIGRAQATLYHCVRTKRNRAREGRVGDVFARSGYKVRRR